MKNAQMSLMRRQLLGTALLAAIARPVLAADAPVRLVVGFPPGGTLDIVARFLSEPLSEQLGRTVIVENRPGAGSLIAAQNVARATPDGATLLLAPVVVPAFFPALYPTLNFDPLEDLVPVAELGDFSFALVVGAKVPANNLQEFVAYLKANADTASYGTLSAGTPSHFLGVLFNEAAGTNMLGVPYKGGAPVMTALLGGEIQAAFVPSGAAVELHKAGRIKVLGVSGHGRSSLLPDVPLLSEEMPGLAEMDSASLWYGFFAPKGTDAATAAKLNKAIVAVLKQPKVLQQLAPEDLQIQYPSASDFSARVRRDSKYWGDLIRSTGFTLE